MSEMVQADSAPAAIAERSPVQPIHGSIIQAICKIMTAVSAVKKSQKNQHGGYHFASTDDIYASITHKMGEVGLVVLTREEQCNVVRVEKEGKTAQWAHMKFSFVLATAEATWTDPTCVRTLYIQVTGPQTFQAAQSYAEKSFLRSLLKLPTGDMDLDGMPQADDEDAQVALSQPAKRKSSSGAKKDGTDKLFNEIRTKIVEAAGRRDILSQIRTLYADEWSAMPPRWAEILDNEYEDALSSCREAAE